MRITNYELRITNEERRFKRTKNLLLRLNLRSSFVIRNSQFVIQSHQLPLVPPVFTGFLLKEEGNAPGLATLLAPGKAFLVCLLSFLPFFLLLLFNKDIVISIGVEQI